MYLYSTFCFTCHDTNGKGIAALRASMPELPDFTAKLWQKSRTDADLGHSILEGKGQFMLPMKDKLGSVDVKQMVALVRGFDGGQQIIEPEPIKTEGPILKPDPTMPSDLLPQELAALAANTASFVGSPSGYGPMLAASGALLAASGAFSVKAKPVVVQEPTVPDDLGPRLRVGANIFRQFCLVCHGPDGTGSLMRRSMPPIPDFTTTAFHTQHTDAQIRVSILEGKGTLMPANRGRITEEQARDLVPYIRSFGPASIAIKPGTTDTNFEKAVRDLEKQLEELHKEMQKIKGKP
jgi:mono/diheme cytochrome c family protein